jgi:myosin heavy subunit
MDFRTLATSETATLLKSALAGRSQRTGAAIKALHDALDAAIKSAVEKLDSDTPAIDVAPMAERLAAAARAETDAEAARIRADAQKKIDAAKKEFDAAAAERAKLSGEVEKTKQRLEKTSGELEQAQHRLEQEHGELEQARRRSEQNHGELEQTRRKIDQVTGELEKAREDLDRAADERTRLKAAVLDAEGAWADEVRSREAAEKEKAELRDTLTQTRLETRNTSTQMLDHLISTFQKLETSKSAADVLAGIINGLSLEFPRVVLLEVRDDHLEATQQAGFGSTRHPKIDVLADEHSAIGDALLTRLVQSRSGEETAADPSHRLFGGSPSFILALPVSVHGEVLAVIYVDDFKNGHTETDFVVTQRRVKYAQLVLWHAVPRLPRFVKARESTELCA